MAKYSVDHSCGHTVTHQLIGPHKERDRKIAWLEGRPCTDCWREGQDRQRAEASTKAAEANRATGLPELEGSPKQVAWAESIRRPICAALREAEGNLHFGPDFPAEARDELAGAVALLVDEVVGKASAKWWIDEGRDMDITTASAPRWLARQIRARGLAPTATSLTEEED